MKKYNEKLLNLTAKLNFLASFINLRAIPLSNRVLRAKSSKFWRKWNVTLSIMTTLTCKEITTNYQNSQDVEEKIVIHKTFDYKYPNQERLYSRQKNKASK